MTWWEPRTISMECYNPRCINRDREHGVAVLWALLRYSCSAVWFACRARKIPRMPSTLVYEASAELNSSICVFATTSNGVKYPITTCLRSREHFTGALFPLLIFQFGARQFQYPRLIRSQSGHITGPGRWISIRTDFFLLFWSPLMR